MANDDEDEDYTEEDFEETIEVDDFNCWWEEEGSLSSSRDDKKDIAQDAWIAAYRFYTGND
jgi:hypothetical protein